MRPGFHLLLVLSVLAAPFAAAQSDTSPMTLKQAVDTRQRDSQALKAEADRLASEVSKAQQASGPFQPATADLRRKMAEQHWRYVDAERDYLTLSALLRRSKAAAKQQPLKDWLEAAQQEKLAALALPPGPADAHDYSSVDDYARNTPREVAVSVPKLAAYLAKGGKDDREKARAIFVWICENLVYDQDVLAGRIVEFRPEFVLRARAGECTGHAHLFNALAKAAGLKTQLVTGHERQLDVDPAYASRSKKFGGAWYTTHLWNAVQLDGRWYIVDTSLGNTHMKKQGKVDMLGPRRDEWFLVPPGEAIYSHWPTDAKLQFLDRPLVNKEHAGLPLLEPAAFRHDVRLWPSGNPVLNVADSVVLRARAPKGVTVAGVVAVRNTPQQGWVLEQRDAETGDTDLYAAFPRPGTYLLRVFAGKGTPGKAKMDTVADYRIEVKKGKGETFRMPYAWPGFRDNGCYLYEPLTGILKGGTKVAFKVRAPGAKRVGVSVGNMSVPLEGKDGVFAGEVMVPPGDSGLLAEFADRPGMFVPLVSYKAE